MRCIKLLEGSSSCCYQSVMVTPVFTHDSKCNCSGIPVLARHSSSETARVVFTVLYRPEALPDTPAAVLKY